MQVRSQTMNTVDATASIAGAYTYMHLCTCIALYYESAYSILRMHKLKKFVYQAKQIKTLIT